MKKIRKITCAILVLIVAVSMLAILSGCSKENETSAGTTDTSDEYQVKVVDALGNPYTEGLVVRFMQNGQQVAMQVPNNNGVASKDLADGEYNVELQFSDSDAKYHYDISDLKLTENNKTAEVVLSYTVDTAKSSTLKATSLLSNERVEHTAYDLNVCCTYIELAAGERNFFTFTPTNGGTYEFTIADSDAVIGYYGSTHFVQDKNVAENITENGFTLSISNTMVGSVLVIGVDATGKDDTAIVCIQRTGNPQETIEDVPETVYKTTAALAEYKLPFGAELNDFDIMASTDTYRLVYNESDGYYHLNSADGALVLVRLGKASGGSTYLVSFEEILERSGLKRYFYDENGKCIKIESYSECVLEYFEFMDENSGLYPLTEDLKYIIQQRGIQAGWFDPDSPGYLFEDDNSIAIPGINNEISWLFCCVYID